MATPTQGAKPTPERIFNTLNAYQQSAALKAAIELDIFTKIAEGANQPKQLAESTSAAERGIRILCDYLTILGFLTKEQNRYALTQESAIFLDRKSPACLASMAGFLGGDPQRKRFDLLTEAVRKGGSVAGRGDNTNPDDEMWVEFAKSMASLTTPSANFIAQMIGSSQPCRVLDIAAGHGMSGITVAKHNPNARVVALDWPAVLEVAKTNARGADLDERFGTIEGSAFTADLGQNYDYVLLTNILHHFDPATCETLLKRVFEALGPAGKTITLEFVPNEDRIAPPTSAAFSLVMLANTDAGDAYTFSEFERMFQNTGFAKTTLHAVPDMPQQVLVSEKQI
ncbi:MAG TPA: methyltransferase [Candidatus Acidoferrum sp.]